MLKAYFDCDVLFQEKFFYFLNVFSDLNNNQNEFLML